MGTIKAANPVICWVTGSLSVDFTFDPGENPKLFNISITRNGEVLANLLLHAQSEEHVREIFNNALRFYDHAKIAYESNTGRLYGNTRKLEPMREAMGGSDVYTVMISEAPKDQFYKVSWAHNDTLI